MNVKRISEIGFTMKRKGTSICELQATPVIYGTGYPITSNFPNFADLTKLHDADSNGSRAGAAKQHRPRASFAARARSPGFSSTRFHVLSLLASPCVKSGRAAKSKLSSQESGY